MTLYKELDYTSKIREIDGVQFSVLSPDEIKRRSVVHVTQTILFDSSGTPVVGGLFDTRMGSIDNGKICPTDGLDNRFCPGYFGHIELCKPVFHIQFIDIVLKILKCICIRCSKLLIEKSNPEMSEVLKVLKGRTRWKYIIDKCSKIKICGSATEDGCGALQPSKITKEGLSRIHAEWVDKKDKSIALLTEEEKKQLLTAEHILKIFKRISDEDSEMMGLSAKWCRPDWLICTILPVPPPAVRPSIKQFNSVRSEDDITHKLHDIVKTNNNLRKKLENEKTLENTIDEWIQVLQYHVATFVDNEISGINQSTHRSGRPLKSLIQRLKGKDGRIRGNLMGKRVDFSARSVITPDPNIKIDELGVPFKVAMNQTFPEKVTPYNIDKLHTFVRNGPFKHPGAKSIKRKIDGRTMSLQYVDTDTIELSYGDIVHRHLMDDDIVLFNRQPSLHKMSMMAHRVRVMEYYTFRLNVSVTKPYNADFDGDEMNMHVPQSLQTATELEELAYVPYQIISPRVHKPVIALYQDSMLGLNRITNDNVYLSKIEVMNILTYIPGFNGILPEPEKKNPERYSGRQLISIVLPNELNVDMKNDSYDDSKDEDDKLNHVIIKNGKLIQGRIDSKIMDTGSRGLIHIIYNDFGYKTCQRFLDDLQNIVTRYLILSGFSVGISDLIADKETNEKIKNTIVKKKKDVAKLVQQVHQQLFDNNSASTILEEFEKDVNKALNRAINEAGKIGLSSLSKDNRMTNMVLAGSKGKSLNISQMVACVGQQNVDAKRIPNGYNDRALPHFTKYNVSPEAKGFVENSFINGLTPEEFFFHAMGGREGLIDTAVKSITGDTEIVIMENKSPKYTTIGNWIDNHLKIHKDSIKYYGAEDANMELLDISKLNIDTYIPTTDTKGNMSWEVITNITRHDPSEFIYIIKTKSGRDVKVVESKSLLVWNNESEEYEPKETGEVQVGDKMPVSINLQNTINRMTNIDMNLYLSRKESINNNVFELNNENGFLIGLYLACGYNNNNNKKIELVELSTDVLNRVEKIFNTYNIKYRTQKYKEDKVKIFDVYANRNPLLNFVVQFIESNPNSIPIELQFAPNDFLEGFIDGYYSRRAKVNRHSICLSFELKKIRVAEQISMMLTRFGIFSNFVKNDYSIELVINKLFASKFIIIFKLTDKTKQEQLGKIRNTKKGYIIQNDTILDEIVSIEKCPSENYPKVYDLTIPKTKNFGLANGLQVYDTSETGYIQRKLIKAMEDLKVYHNLSVRNADGNIIQYIYGEDGMNYTKIETQPLNYFNSNYTKIEKEHKFPNTEDFTTYLTAATVKEMKSVKSFRSRLTEYFNQIVEDVYQLRSNMFRNYRDNNVKYPVNLSRLINTIKNKFELVPDITTNLNPLYVIDSIKSLIGKLRHDHTDNGVKLFHILIRYYLSPKQIVKVHRFNRMAFDYLVGFIEMGFNNSLVEPSEMVGPIAAQSIGEPATQMTLNSVTYDTPIIVRDSNKKIRKINIGEFVENNIKLSDNVDYYKNKDTTYAEISKDRYLEIPSATEDGEIVWRRIEAVTQHPVVNEDNTNTLIKVVTCHGREVTATKAKSFLQLREGKITPVEGKNLKVGDYLPASRLPIDFAETQFLDLQTLFSVNGKSIENENIPDKVELDYDFGYSIGMYCANVNGNFTKTANIDFELMKRLVYKLCGRTIHNKFISDKIIFSNRECLLGVLDGFIGINGVIDKNKKSIELGKDASILSRELLEDIRQILNIFGIYSKIYGGSKTWYGLSVVNFQAQQLANILHMKIERKQDALEMLKNNEYKYEFGIDDERVPNIINNELTMESRNNRFFNIQFDKIKTIEEVFNPTEYVYDLTVEDTRNFNIYNGLCERDTFHYAGVSEKSNVTRGVPRLKELLHISKTIKIPSLNIYLDDEHRYNKDKALTLLNRIELTKLKDITNSIRIYYDPDDYNTNITEDVTLMEIYKIFNGLDACMRDEENATGSEWIIRFEFDKQKMVEKDITMEDIYHRINVTYGEDISCIYSDDNSSKLVFRIRIIKMRKSDADKDLINNLNTLKAYAKAMRDNVIIKGIENIVNVSMYKNQNNFEYINKSFNQRDEWVLDTHGVNLLKVLMYPGVDYTRTISNDIYEVYEIFGIEAAKTVLMNEIKQVIEGAGSYVNFRHVALLVDTMTNRGYLMSIDRFGINRGNIGPLAKCSFEETTDQLFKASIFGEVDKLNGVSANIMMGQIPPCGTGDSEILLDETKLFEIEPDEEVELDDIEDWGELDYCEENVNIDFDIDNVGEKNIELDEMVKVEIETKIN